MHNEIDMDAVCDALIPHGIPSYVEQTVGRFAAIYVGPPNADGYHVIAAGPGIFEGPAWTLPKGQTGDFYVGPHDDGDTRPVVIPEGASEQDIVNVIVAQWKAATIG